MVLKSSQMASNFFSKEMVEMVTIVMVVGLSVLVTKGKCSNSAGAGGAVQRITQTTAPAMQWHKGYGTRYGNHVHEGMQTSDGGFIAIGQTWEGHSGYTDMLVVKTDADGNKQWQAVIGTKKGFDVGICIAEVSDGYIAGGGLYSGSSQQRVLVKLDFNGKIVKGWPKTYAGSANGAIRGIDITDDGSVVTTGYVNCPQPGFVFIVDDGQGFLMKTDADGNVQWDQPLSVPQGTKVRQIKGGFAVCSTARVPGGYGKQDVCLIKTDSRGKQISCKSYGSTEDDQCYDFDLTSDGGFIFAGHTRSYGVRNWDYLLLKVGPDGKEQWHRTFGQPRGYDPNYIHDESYGVKQTPDGGFIVAGGSGDEYRYSACGHPAGCSDEWKAYLVKTDSHGNVLWHAVYPPQGDIGNNAAEYVNLTRDGGYIVFTDSDSAGNLPTNTFGFMKIAPEQVN